LQQQAGGAIAQLRRFILALGECEFAISGVLDELQRDAFTTVADHRPARCTGTALQVRCGQAEQSTVPMYVVRAGHYASQDIHALPMKSRCSPAAGQARETLTHTHSRNWNVLHTQVAAGLTDAALPKGNCAVRIMLFVGGPTTEGGGQVVDKELSEPIRSHKARRLPLFTLG